MYGLPQYVGMMLDRVRIDAYAEALRREVRRDDVVVDLGCGLGIFCVLAARAGARRVFGVEPAESVHHAQRVVEENGCADRVTIFRGRIEDVTLPEAPTLVVADLRGPLPLDAGAARAWNAALPRLAAGARTIPRRDTVYATPIASEELRRRTLGGDSIAGVDFGAVRDAVVRHVHAAPSDVVALAPPRPLFEIRYDRPQAGLLEGRAEFTIERGPALDGLLVGFEADLAPGVTYRSFGPGAATAYGACALPRALAPSRGRGRSRDVPVPRPDRLRRRRHVALMGDRRRRGDRAVAEHGRGRPALARRRQGRPPDLGPSGVARGRRRGGPAVGISRRGLRRRGRRPRAVEPSAGHGPRARADTRRPNSRAAARRACPGASELRERRYAVDGLEIETAIDASAALERPATGTPWPSPSSSVGGGSDPAGIAWTGHVEDAGTPWTRYGREGPRAWVRLEGLCDLVVDRAARSAGIRLAHADEDPAYLLRRCLPYLVALDGASRCTRPVSSSTAAPSSCAGRHARASRPLRSRPTPPGGRARGRPRGAPRAGRGVEALASFPWIEVYGASLAALRPGGDAEDEKRRVACETSDPTPRPGPRDLLPRRGRSRSRDDGLPEGRGARLFTDAAFVGDPSDAGEHERRLDFATALARDVPCADLTVPDGLAALAAAWPESNAPSREGDAARDPGARGEARAGRETPVCRRGRRYPGGRPPEAGRGETWRTRVPRGRRPTGPPDRSASARSAGTKGAVAGARDRRLRLRARDGPRRDGRDRRDARRREADVGVVTPRGCAATSVPERPRVEGTSFLPPAAGAPVLAPRRDAEESEAPAPGPRADRDRRQEPVRRGGRPGLRFREEFAEALRRRDVLALERAARDEPIDPPGPKRRRRLAKYDVRAEVGRPSCGRASPAGDGPGTPRAGAPCRARSRGRSAPAAPRRRRPDAHVEERVRPPPVRSRARRRDRRRRSPSAGRCGAPGPCARRPPRALGARAGEASGGEGRRGAPRARRASRAPSRGARARRGARRGAERRGPMANAATGARRARRPSRPASATPRPDVVAGHGLVAADARHDEFDALVAQAPHGVEVRRGPAVVGREVVLVEVGVGADEVVSDVRLHLHQASPQVLGEAPRVVDLAGPSSERRCTSRRSSGARPSRFHRSSRSTAKVLESRPAAREEGHATAPADGVGDGGGEGLAEPRGRALEREVHRAGPSPGARTEHAVGRPRERDARGDDPDAREQAPV